MGCSIINAAPKQAENVACGSLMPSSVPATCCPMQQHASLDCYALTCIRGLDVDSGLIMHPDNHILIIYTQISLELDERD